MKNSKYHDTFFYKRLPVIQGFFTLRQVLSEKLIEKIKQSRIDTDLDIPLSHFVNTPCTEYYTLYFQWSHVAIHSNSNLIEDIRIFSKDNNQYFNIEIRFGIDDCIHVIYYLDTDDYETVEIYDNDTILTDVIIPKEYVDNIRILVENGEISDKDGLKINL